MWVSDGWSGDGAVNGFIPQMGLGFSFPRRYFRVYGRVQPDGIGGIVVELEMRFM
jgi:hypothetical protein